MKTLRFKQLLPAVMLLGAVSVYAQGGITSDLGVTVTGTTDSVVTTETNLDAKTDINVETDLDTSNQNETPNTNNSGAVTTTTDIQATANPDIIISSSQVKNDSDLEAFHASIMEEDDSVVRIKTDSRDSNNDNSVQVGYKHKGKLLGFIPVWITSTTKVETDAETGVHVNSRMPWWSFLVTKESYSRTDLETRIANNPRIQAALTAQASAQAKAEVIEAIVAELRTSVAAHAEVNSN